MNNTTRKPEAIIIGCGVAGLTTALRLLESGFAVHILARDLPPDTTSNIAAALWYPYKAYPQEKVLRWSHATFDAFHRQAQAGVPGIFFKPLIELFPDIVPDPWWKSAVADFRHARPEELPSGYRHGFVATTPVIETPVYMPYLMKRVTQLGATIQRIERGVQSLAEVASQHSLIINCSGLGARDLVADKAVFPIRGQIVRMKNPGVTRCFTEDAGPLAISYTIARTNDIILGGTAEENMWDTTPNPKTAHDIVARCATLEPALAQAEVLETYVGLRPARHAVRLEPEKISPNSLVIHNYGHGGAGFTLSWGCADEVATLALAPNAVRQKF